MKKDSACFSDLGIKSFHRGNCVSAAPASDREENFSVPNRLSRPRSRTLHVRTLLRKKKVVFGLVNLKSKVES